MDFILKLGCSLFDLGLVVDLLKNGGTLQLSHDNGILVSDLLRILYFIFGNVSFSDNRFIYNHNKKTSCIKIEITKHKNPKLLYLVSCGYKGCSAKKLKKCAKFISSRI